MTHQIPIIWNKNQLIIHFGSIWFIIEESTVHEMTDIKRNRIKSYRNVWKCSCLVSRYIRRRSVPNNIPRVSWCYIQLQLKIRWQFLTCGLLTTGYWTDLVNCVANYQYDNRKKGKMLKCLEYYRKVSLVFVEYFYHWKNRVSTSRTTSWGHMRWNWNNKNLRLPVIMM